ncbi:MAG: site-specific integrase [Nitrospirae bacterium]|nr:site-specific integrase [Nitrospirota bacterium]
MTKGIYKRGNVYWIRYSGLDGKTVYESSGSPKFREAEALLINRRQSIKEGKQPEIKKIANHTFRELSVQYLIWAERQRSFRSKKGFVLQLVELYGNLPLRRFSTMLLEQLQTDKTRNGNKPATVNRHIATIKHMFRKAVEWDMVEEDTLKKISRVKLLEENNRRLRYLSQVECQSLINACDTHLKPIIITALNSGMRKGEILSLKWDNVDLQHGFILLDITKNGERREIPINNTLNEIFRGITRRLDVPYVFFDSKTGKPYLEVKRSFNTACKKAKIMDFHFHDLRHTFASQLVMAGIDITTIKELLGHKTLTMTLRYAHLAPSHKVKAVDILDNCLTSKMNYTKTIQFGEGLK